MVAGRVKSPALALAAKGPSRVALDADGEVLLARIARADLTGLPADSLDVAAGGGQAVAAGGTGGTLPTWNYIWDLILANPATGRGFSRRRPQRHRREASRAARAIRGSRSDIFVGRGAEVHPMVVLDAEHGPIYIDEGAEIHPFTRIEGPCYIGRKSILLGAKCREGNSIGPMCRIGGEVEESIIQGYSNKYHDGFLGHAYVGQWVNLGALTTNSDLKNDYGRVRNHLGRPHAHRHRFDQGGGPDRRPYEDLASARC